eukprot:COSAG02_NODE_2071_length_9933_cov_5.490136_1_plen_60_part_00
MKTSYGKIEDLLVQQDRLKERGLALDALDVAYQISDTRSNIDTAGSDLWTYAMAGYTRR